MRVPARAPEQRGDTAAVTPRRKRPAARAGAALALQRAAGNRAATRVLARWTKHPDAEKKGVVVPDVVAAEYNRFNPPKNA